jgi:hypothetical protein
MAVSFALTDRESLKASLLEQFDLESELNSSLNINCPVDLRLNSMRVQSQNLIADMRARFNLEMMKIPKVLYSWHF